MLLLLPHTDHWLACTAVVFGLPRRRHSQTRTLTLTLTLTDETARYQRPA